MTDLAEARRGVDRLPRQGWCQEPTPTTELAGLATELGLAWVGAKRDDLGGPLFGGTKLRKLDLILATDEAAAAKRWLSMGAIGSGQLVTTAAAAEFLGRPLDALCVWQPMSAAVVDNLAYVASCVDRLFYTRSRLGLLCKHPMAVMGRSRDGTLLIPAGATSPAGMAGLVSAAFELADQVAAGELPQPNRIIVPLGSGGIAVGLSVGLRLAGLDTTVHAVAVVERWLSPHWRLRSLERSLRRWLAARGVSTEGLAPAKIVVDRSQLGRGYGSATDAANIACDRAKREGIDLESVYSGKAMAALLGGCSHPDEHVLFWVTPRRAVELPRKPDWDKRLPAPLAGHLGLVPGRRITRRRLVLGGMAAAALMTWFRVSGYPSLPGWQGVVLAPWEAQVVRAAAEALLTTSVPPGVVADIPIHVDRYLTGFPEPLLDQAHLLLAAVEHSTTPLGLRLSRFTNLEPADRERWLADLSARGGVQGEIYRGIRDLVMLGCYQDPRTWETLDYDGPLVGRGRRPTHYDALAAAPGVPPWRLPHGGVVR